MRQLSQQIIKLLVGLIGEGLDSLKDDKTEYLKMGKCILGLLF